MRIRVVQKPSLVSIDGIQLDRFEVGQQYDVGSTIGALFLAEGWAEPIATDDPSASSSLAGDPFGYTPQHDPDRPPNLIREQYPACLNDVALAAEFPRRRRPREWPPRK